MTAKCVTKLNRLSGATGHALFVGRCILPPHRTSLGLVIFVWLCSLGWNIVGFDVHVLQGCHLEGLLRFLLLMFDFNVTGSLQQRLHVDGELDGVSSRSASQIVHAYITIFCTCFESLLPGVEVH